MSDIDRQLERLRSPNKDTRYEACEELRVTASIPPEAFTALELAAKDEDALVADAARRALLIQRLPPSGGRDAAESLSEGRPAKSRAKWGPSEISFGLALLINAVAVFLISFITGSSDLGCLFGGLVVVALILGLGAGAGSLCARGVGANPEKGAVVGIWLGFSVSLVITVGAVFGLGS
jgi:hypothetical protein